jgi:uncharacterized iron-regulated membrane protein
MRKVVFTLHRCAALVTGVFVLILGVTGAVMAFEPELDHLLHPRLFHVSRGEHAQRLSQLADTVSLAFPGERVFGYGLSVSPDVSYYVALPTGLVFVNQYTGEILGVRSAPTLLDEIHQLHLRLLAGDTGKTIVSWIGVVAVFLALSGFYLWWPVKRISIAWRQGGRRFWFDLHNAVGVVSLVFLLMLSVTGVVIGFERVSGPMLYKMTGSQPLPVSFSSTRTPGAKPIDVDRALDIARAALPGATAISLNVPGPKGAYRVAARYPEDLTPGGRSRIFIDQYSGEVLQVESSRTTAAGTRLVILNRAIHTGDIFGLPSKVVMSLASVAAALQVISGVVMWCKRPRASASTRRSALRTG